MLFLVSRPCCPEYRPHPYGAPSLRAGTTGKICKTYPPAVKSPRPIFGGVLAMLAERPRNALDCQKNAMSYAPMVGFSKSQVKTQDQFLKRVRGSNAYLSIPSAI
jgi:hypothetical protein